MTMRQFQPIAPAPIKPTLPATTTTTFLASHPPPAQQPPQGLSYIAHGPNGSMYIITNPPAQPQMNPNVLHPGGFPLIINQPQQNLLQQSLIIQNGAQTSFYNPPATPATQQIFIQPPPATDLTVHTPTTSSTPASMMSSLLSPREAALLTAPTPEVATPEPSREPLLDIPEVIEREEEEEVREDEDHCEDLEGGANDGVMEITHSDGSVTFAHSETITFEVENNALSSLASAASDNTDNTDKTNSDSLTYRTENGETIKLDILERAILEIPDLMSTQEFTQTNLSTDENVCSAAVAVDVSGPTSPANEPSRDQSGRESEKIEEEEEVVEEEEEVEAQKEQDEAVSKCSSSRAETASSTSEGNGQTQGRERLLSDEESQQLLQQQQSLSKGEKSKSISGANLEGDGEELKKRGEDCGGPAATVDNLIGDSQPSNSSTLIEMEREDGEAAEVEEMRPATKKPKSNDRETFTDNNSSSISDTLAGAAATTTTTTTTPPSLFMCSKCGRKYKFENFLKVHQRRPC